MAILSGRSLKRKDDPFGLLRPRRRITGISEILLPFTEKGKVAWDDFRNHVVRTADAGLTPAVNTDMGYVNHLSPKTRQGVLQETREALGSRPFVAGAFVADRPGARWNPSAYFCEIDQIRHFDATPIIFQSFGLTSGSNEHIVESYAEIGEHVTEFIASELSDIFAPFGMIYDLETFTGVLDVPQCIGARHSSLSRKQEWQRLAIRDNRRPGFRLFTGNERAIDMVMYGSDYLLGLSTFAPDYFAKRDAYWESGDPAFYELNDVLQYLGSFSFRSPVPAYKHSAAQFLKLRGWIQCSNPHPDAARRPDHDVEILSEIASRLESFEE